MIASPGHNFKLFIHYSNGMKDRLISTSQPPGSSFPARVLFKHWSTHKQACLEAFQLAKIIEPEKNNL